MAIACDLRHAEIPREDFRNLTWAEGMGPGTSRENIRRNREAVEILGTFSFVNPGQIAMYGHSGGGHLTVGFLALGNGDISLTIPQETNAWVQASVGNGQVRYTNLDFEELQSSVTYLVGRLGDGSGGISISVGNGDIRLEGK